MSDLNEIDFADAAIHQLQRTGATDDYAEYLAEIEGHNRQQNNLQQLQKQREDLAEQMAQISLQMQTLDEQIREIQEVAQAPPAEAQAVTSDDENREQAVTVANRLSQMNEEDQEQELMFMQEGNPHLADLIFANLAKMRRQNDPAFEEVAEVAESHNDHQKRLAAVEEQREALVRQIPNTTGFEAQNALQQQIHEIDLQLHQLEDQEPESEETALHLEGVKRAADPEPYEELAEAAESHNSQERLAELERLREGLVRQIGVCSGWGQNDTLRPDVSDFSTCIRLGVRYVPIRGARCAPGDRVNNRSRRVFEQLPLCRGAWYSNI